MVDERYFSKDHASRQIEEEDEPWVEALRAIDDRERRDKSQLLELLLNNAPMSETVRWHLADLIGRYKIATLANKGGKRAPSYDYPPAQKKLVRAKAYYEHFLHKGMTDDQAIEKAAERCDVKRKTFRLYIAGRHTSARRVKKRKPPPNPRP